MAVSLDQQVGENIPPTTECSWPVNLFVQYSDIDIPSFVDIRRTFIRRLRRIPVFIFSVVDYFEDLGENTFRFDNSQTEVIDALPTSSTRGDEVEINIENDDSDSEVIDLSQLFDIPLDHHTLVTFNDYPEFFSPPGTPVPEVAFHEEPEIVPNPVAVEPIEEEDPRCPCEYSFCVYLFIILVAGLVISPFLVS